MRMTQSAINQSNGFLGDVSGLDAVADSFVLGGLCCHKMPQRPRRFRLLVVMLKLSTIRDTLVAICSFSSKFPARPLPCCTPSSSCFNVAVEDSTFFTATLISGELVATNARTSRAAWLIWSEK